MTEPLPLKTTIYLIRHGEVEGHQFKRFNGQLDVPLTSNGVLQYKKTLDALSAINIKACYTSDLKRCVDGAKLFSDQFGVGFVKKKELREIDVGI